MAKGKKDEGPKGPAPWMATFSDLMNLLLCFFVLLFSMSSVDAEKFELVIASLQSSMSILPAGGSAIGDGNMVGAGINQLEFLDNFFNELPFSHFMFFNHNYIFLHIPLLLTVVIIDCTFILAL